MKTTSGIKYLYVLFYVLSAGTLLAQQDPKAIAMMEKMTAILDSAPSVTAGFDYTYKNVRTGEEFSADGEIWIKGNRYKISLPDQQAVTYFDGKTIWSYMESTNEVNIANPDPSTEDFFISNPLALFRLYKKDYKLKYLGETAGTNNCELDLFPIDIKKPYHRIRLTLDRNTGMLVKAVASGKNGESYEVKLSKVHTDKLLDDNFFVFLKSKHPGVVEIDLRE
ncbi:MAG: outer membrane lipoprotein carrier protein LolA [Bacteroidales bacterium]